MTHIPPANIAPYHLHFQATTGSTNADAIMLAKNNAPEFSLVVAQAQTAAHGRHGRQWDSGLGNVFWSVVLRPNVQLNRSELALVAALAVQKTAAEHTPTADIRIKWPNDVVAKPIHEQGAWAKISGILVETGGTPQNPWAVVGIGMNVVSAPAITPKQNAMVKEATCLQDLGATTHAPKVITTLCQHVHAFYTQWQEGGGFNALKDAYHQHMWRLNESLVVSLNADKTDILTGINEGVNDRGALLLKTPEGLKHLHVGDI